MPKRRARQRFDTNLIVRRLRATAQHWVPRLFPHGRQSGRDWRLANIRGDPPRRSGSCVITLEGPHAGDWFDFDGNKGGGPLSTLQAALGLSGSDLIQEAANMTGTSGDVPTPKRKPSSPPRRSVEQIIADILSGAQPPAGTPVEAYLSGRGLILPAGADLLFHPALLHYGARTRFPAMIGRVRDVDGKPMGILRTYLEAGLDGNYVKANVDKPKKMLGPVGGGAVRLTELGNETDIALSEGIESGLAAATVRPDLPIWATLSTAGLINVQLPAQITRVLILADFDASGAGLRAAEEAAERFRREGRKVAIALPPRVDEDFNDLLLKDGAEVVRRIVDEALDRATAGKVETEPHLPLNFQHSTHEHPSLAADDGDLARATNHAWDIIVASNRHRPWLFRLSNKLTWVVSADDDLPSAVQLDAEHIRYMLARIASWQRTNKEGESVPAPPPMLVVDSILATPNPPVPILTRIVNTPVFGKSGKLQTECGYHPDARLLYLPAPGFSVPPVPEQPSGAEIAAARTLLCDDFLRDFPFIGPAEKAHAIALLLAGFARAMIDGPTPLHLIEKPVPGSGATLLVDCMAMILTGARASVMKEGSTDDEWRKRITARLRQLPAMVLIDNVRGPLDSASLAAALTAPFWQDRILGSSSTERLPVHCAWIATGNNPECSNEIARRVVRIRLDPRVEQPWLRTGFRHANLTAWVRSNRARLVAAGLTLVQAWVAAGSPPGSASIGSYENWARCIGGVLEVAGIEGFLANIDDLLEASDAEGRIIRSFISAWWGRFGRAEVGAGDLFDLALASDLPLGNGPDRSQRTRLGKTIGRLRDRTFVIGDVTVQVQAIGVSHQARRWKLS